MTVSILHSLGRELTYLLTCGRRNLVPRTQTETGRQTDRQRERAELGKRIYLLMLLLTALSYRPSWTPRLLLLPARYDPKDRHPGSPHRSPTPRQNVRVLSVPGANRDLLFTGKSTSQRNTYYSAFHTAKIRLLHFQNCGLCIMQDVVFGHECDAWKKHVAPTY